MTSNQSKSINLFLLNGKVNGIIKCTLPNWTGVSYKIPRTELENCKNRKDLLQSGVYFLFGVSEDDNQKEVYIGQAGIRKNGEGLLLRLFEHRANAENEKTNINYWNEAIVFTTSNNTFGPTEISFLENKFFNLTKEANRYNVKNSQEPTIGNITEEKESELNEFIDYAKIVMGTLGHKVFEPLVEPKQNSPSSQTQNSNELLLTLTRKSKKSNITIKASCKQTSDGFVVLKGSIIETINSNTIPERIKIIRQNAKIDENGVLQKDILFNSPSYAAAFVVGGNVNGLTSWITENGESLKDLESKQ